MNKEYIIWGIPSDQTEEVIAFTQAKTLREANNVIKILSEKYGLTKLRIQIIDLTNEFNLSNVFSKTIN